MKYVPSVIALAVALGFSPLVSAETRPEHFQGEPAETLEQAISNFSQYNAKLEDILEKQTLTPEDLHEVHQLTYTLENALQKIDAEYKDLAEALETVHIASESAQPGTVQTEGKAYLETARKLVD